MYNLQAVADKGWHDAAEHPCSRYSTDKQQYDYRRGGGADILDDGILKGAPLASADSYCKQRSHRGGKEQSNLTTAHNGVRAETLDYKSQNDHKHNKRYCCNP